MKQGNSKAEVERRRAAWADQLTQELNRQLKVLKTCPDVVNVIVFGSYGRGTPRYRSDLDLIVIQHTNLRFLDRAEALYQLICPRLPTDLLVYTPQEWKDLTARKSFAKRALNEGKLVYAAATQD